MRNKRKLIRYEMFLEIVKQAELGVPYTKLVREHQLSLTSQHLSNLIKKYQTLNKDSAAQQFNPEWLNADGDSIQEPPNDIAYQGLFPWGQWINRDIA